MSPVEEGPIWPAEVYRRVSQLQQATLAESLELRDRLNELRHQVAAHELASRLEATADELSHNAVRLCHRALELRERPLA